MNRIAHNRVEALRNAEFYDTIRRNLDNAEELIWIHGMVTFHLYESSNASRLYDLLKQYETSLKWYYMDGIQKTLQQLRDEMGSHFIEYSQWAEEYEDEEDVEEDVEEVYVIQISDFRFPVRSKL